MLKNFFVENCFEDFGEAGYESNRAIVGGLTAVTFFRDRLYESELPARRKGASE